MIGYKVTFFKTLLSSSGHPVKCPQQAIEIHRARNFDRAVAAAKRRYERLLRLPNHVGVALLVTHLYEFQDVLKVSFEGSIAVDVLLQASSFAHQLLRVARVVP